MSRTLAWLHHLTTLLVGGSGLLWAWMIYLAEPPPPDEFGLSLVSHPWQPATQAWHVVTSPALVFLGGALWMVHVLPRLRGGRPRCRRTGRLLALLFFPMVASGYLLQVSIEESWRGAWALIHLASSLLWIVILLVHLIAARRSEDEPWDGADWGA